MNATTIRRLLIGLGVVLGAGTLMLIVTGDPEAGDTARGLLAVALFVGAASWLVYRYRVLPRRAQFADQAGAVGFRSGAGDPLRMLERPFAPFRWSGSVRSIENTATGVHGDRQVAILDYWFAPTAEPRYEDIERYTCVVAPAPAGWSALSVVPERWGSRALAVLGVRDIEFESERFNRAFQVRAADRRFASALLDAPMMAWLLERTGGTGFEVLGDRLMVFRRRATVSLDDVAEVLALYDAFLDRVPKAVRAAGA